MWQRGEGRGCWLTNEKTTTEEDGSLRGEDRVDVAVPTFLATDLPSRRSTSSVGRVCHREEGEGSPAGSGRRDHRREAERREGGVAGGRETGAAGHLRAPALPSRNTTRPTRFFPRVRTLFFPGRGSGWEWVWAGNKSQKGFNRMQLFWWAGI
jgi:hypothetical protein